jgi:hypothetical protein
MQIASPLFELIPKPAAAFHLRIAGTAFMQIRSGNCGDAPAVRSFVR